MGVFHVFKIVQNATKLRKALQIGKNIKNAVSSHFFVNFYFGISVPF